ncbi:alpha/beta hydrolase [Sulfitobacter donghicola DSW-25 = KCTC 12864 = JCM 14565]|uniref:Alpha/beta hydrolase n=1 Tax=Sulfitobacter donghicola DSW-25 = KCTC 12864 = JCM 14565 TaxID=1300350 RepID=A0A073II09_9RHOB|nr:alpha/beta hydrolase [Sulfitobacter donghicola DSW-25 = KCTC 12864 = JCM 14565]
MATPPNLYLEGTNYPAPAVPAVLRSVTPQILFVTDREPERTEGRITGYGRDRSSAMAFGAASVQFGADDWDDLVARTHVDRNGRISRLTVTKVEEKVRFDSVPLPNHRLDGELRVEKAAADSYDAGRKAFQAQIRAEIARTGHRRILIYTHGVANEFETGVTTLANLWHFAGRDSIPLAFSWPAGNRGPLGYFRDRASGDFSVYHAKEFLTMLAEMPEVEDIDIVAHSRGTGVVTQALRELILVQRARGVRPKLGLKTGTLILAAADLDTGVMRQRLLTERFSEAFEQVNIYVNPDDLALKLSGFLTNSARIGALKQDDFSTKELKGLAKEGLIHFIRVEGAGNANSHSYFRENPAVLSDIVLALRTRAFPGGTLRPLEQDEDAVWVLQPNYPLERLPDLATVIDR